MEIIIRSKTQLLLLSPGAKDQTTPFSVAFLLLRNILPVTIL